MTDNLVKELRASAAAQRAGAPDGATTPLADQLNQAADEIASLREAIRRLAEQDATLSVQGGNVIVTMDATLTDAERAALRDAIGFYINEWGAADDLVVNDSPICRTLRVLLERLGENHA